jgi:HD-GYP domain-containing protein (c-di-GMP phosphodiesterase class II)
MPLIDNKALNIALENNSLILVQKCLYARNLHLYRHSVLTAEIAWDIVVITNEDFGLPATQAYMAGMLHDVGKLFVQDSILDKRQPLTEREWEIMENHPAWGHDYVKGTIFEPFGDVILHHHKLPDGSGYPKRLTSDVLNDRVRLIACADKIAAFLEDRPYRRRISNKDLIYQEVRAVAELYFDGEKVEGIIATVLGGVAVERWASFAEEQFSGMIKETR